MCGPSRPSSGSLIAVIFPSSSPSSSASSSASSTPSSPSSSTSSSLSSNDSSSSTSNASYNLFFRNTTHPDLDQRSQTEWNTSSSTTTKALFRISDPLTRRSFQESAAVHVRIEKYGDLTAENTSPPLHYFRLPMKMQEGDGEFEVALPERLELGVSERGIVGRCVRVGVGMDGIGTGTGIVDMGRGVVGYD
ncbi:hypothetical protein M747DRAFT_108761 [Aspergillus niger ATCC 13496]|uniref:Uncharacterized protein n=1 Tax=Aspergillus niger ATCC 13496 TaxID=1353008 RepID=A0A370BMT9_ASPNG|nr:hypothetical protein ANI_1_3190014 [Aspergillus niger CBS 513.88]RDH16903.1 hypothetical protein M747DRAFT_108761 [Aspergillus niger ATCC 13496]|eukprot:XP_003188565.1 hypothetical protein ANI_1_3190014 [Aspergillus niger CBS 513.88]